MKIQQNVLFNFLRPTVTFIQGVTVALLVIVPVFAESPINLNNQSVTQYNEGDLRGALESLNEALEKSPERAMIFNNRGVVKAALEDYFGALADYNKAIDLNSDKGATQFAFFNRGNLKKEKADYAGAILDYSRAIQINPKYSVAYRERAHARRLAAALDEAKFQELSGQAD